MCDYERTNTFIINNNNDFKVYDRTLCKYKGKKTHNMIYRCLSRISFA